MCNQISGDLFPIVYTKMAPKKKREEMHTIVLKVIERGAQELDLRESLSLSVATLSFIDIFLFHGIDKCDMGYGMLSMYFIPICAASPKAKSLSIKETTNTFVYVNIMVKEGQSLTSFDAR